MRRMEEEWQGHRESKKSEKSRESKKREGIFVSILGWMEKVEKLGKGKNWIGWFGKVGAIPILIGLVILKVGSTPSYGDTQWGSKSAYISTTSVAPVDATGKANS